MTRLSSRPARGLRIPVLAVSSPPTNQTWKVYYYQGSQMIAMRELTGPTINTLYYLHSDHLGSVSVTTNVSGGEVARQNYYPFGTIRPGPNNALPTDRTFTGQQLDSTGLMYYGARYYDPLSGRFISADTDVPESQGPQGLNRYSFVVNNPLKYVDPDGHNPILFGLLVLGAAYVTGRYAIFEGAAVLVPPVKAATYDVIGGALVTSASEAITTQSAQQGVDAALVAAVLRHESAAGDRRWATLLPLQQPGAAANLYETVEAHIRTGGVLGHASIGPGQMQLRRAQMLEELGYVTARSSTEARIQALLGRETSVEYVAGMLHYVSDQLNTVTGFSALSSEYQQRLILLGYNQGWENLLANINAFGLEDTADLAKYDNQTLDEYLRWLAQTGGQ